MDDSERISKINEARRMLLEAADLIEESLHMSGMERRFGTLPGTIRDIAESNDSDSLSNLAKEIEYCDEEHPGWTRPFASPKNITRKDI